MFFGLSIFAIAYLNYAMLLNQGWP